VGFLFLPIHAKNGANEAPGETNVTKQDVMATMVESSARLGRVPSLPELTRTSNVSRRQVRKYFGSYARALAECNLARSGAGYKVAMEELFRDWAGIVRQLKKLPSVNDYASMSRYSPTPLMARFGVWTQVPPNMKQFMEEQGGMKDWQDVLEMIVAQENQETEKARILMPTGWPLKEWPVLVNQPVFGPLISGPVMRPFSMVHGPVNEAGVIYLFGTMAERLGYVVTRMQTDFPDCEAMRRIEGNRWQRVRAEFEYESRNFVKHAHDVNGCDLNICWAHNWPECPLEVLELQKELGNLTAD
jgi:hypothetical protein